MTFEVVPPPQENDKPPRSIERTATFERKGGPLRSNHLITTRLGIKEASPLLNKLDVVYKVSLLTAETPLGREGALAPAEYRLSIMDPIERSRPATEEYVQYVYKALRNNMIPVERVRPNDDNADHS